MANPQQRSSKIGASRRSWTVRRARSRLALGLALATACTGLTFASGAAASTVRHVRAMQPLAVLLTVHVAYQSPSKSARMLTIVPATRPITGEKTTLPIVAQAHGPNGHWLKVMLPGRPNGSSGWIARTGTRETLTYWHIVVNTGARRVMVYFNGHLTKSFEAVVGKPSTPTPTGNFFVEESVILPAPEAGGPFALALSARSNVLQEFAGGPGQIAIHGRDNLGGTLGSAQSHGCIRVATKSISWLASYIGPGVPVTIVA